MSDADNLELKKKARRRLVGAAALALFAAIVLPMTMDQEPPSYPEANPNSGLQVSTESRPGARTTPEPPDLAPPGAEAELAPPPVPPTPVSPARPASTSTPVPASDPAPASAVAPAPPATDDKAAPSAAELKQQNEDRARAEAARVQRLLEGKPPVAVESYVVQIGAFGEAGKAAGIVAELKKLGFSAYTEKAGSMTRVRIGPVVDQRAGEQVVARLKAQGYDSKVVPR
ncbi:hypothetical protein AGMMS49960_08420 [Betaproteobacteria bacterium]|nr:hypothetical protein AGMMS49960_08420 [Betaproteobacteria bacterium]GHU18230.1 hypothetical protein AGMMS50243_07890 [Betaproteobacteria bacterium]